MLRGGKETELSCLSAENICHKREQYKDIFRQTKILSVYHHRPSLRQIIRDFLKAEMKVILHGIHEIRKWKDESKVATISVNLSG